MYSESYSEFKERIYTYLGFLSVPPAAESEEEIVSCLRELETLAEFRYRYQTFSVLPDFLKKEPYLSYLKGCRGVILAVMTLGIGVDRRIKLLQRTDAERALYLDACASALLEKLSDDYEKTLGEDLSYRFCPGYGGSSVSDLKEIFPLLKPEKIGVTLTDTLYMLPSKTMAGVIGIGGGAKRGCGDCFLLSHCKFREEGARCYGSEKK